MVDRKLFLQYKKITDKIEMLEKDGKKHCTEWYKLQQEAYKKFNVTQLVETLTTGK